MSMTDTDRRAAIMAAAGEIAAEVERANAALHADWAQEAVTVCLPDVLRVLEGYGCDTTAGEARWGACSDPDHCIAWITTEEGFEFELTQAVNGPYDTQHGRVEAWLLHPETGRRCYRVTPYSTWRDAALAIHRASPSNLGPEPEPEQAGDVHPADALVDALRAYIASLDVRGGGF